MPAFFIVMCHTAAAIAYATMLCVTATVLLPAMQLPHVVQFQTRCCMSYSCCHCVYQCSGLPHVIRLFMLYSYCHCVCHSVMFFRCHCMSRSVMCCRMVWLYSGCHFVCQGSVLPHAIAHVVQLQPLCMPQCWVCFYCVPYSCLGCIVAATVFASIFFSLHAVQLLLLKVTVLYMHCCTLSSTLVTTP